MLHGNLLFREKELDADKKVIEMQNDDMLHREIMLNVLKNNQEVHSDSVESLSDNDTISENSSVDGSDVSGSPNRTFDSIVTETDSED